MNRFLLINILLLLLVLLFWQFLSGFVAEIVLPSPTSTFKAVKEIVQTPLFLTHVVVTLKRAFLGIFAGIITGSFAGIIIGINKKIHTLFKPYILTLQATPVISWILLALIWVSSVNVAYIVIATSVFPLIALNLSEGIIRVDKKLIGMANFYKVSFKKKLFHIYIPSVMGYVFSSLRIIIGNGVKLAVMAEVLSHPGSGIGERMSWARINVETSHIFAWTIIIIVATFGIDFIMLSLTTREYIKNILIKKYSRI